MSLIIKKNNRARINLSKIKVITKIINMSSKNNKKFLIKI